MRTALRVADVFRWGWAEYDRTHAIAPHQARAVRKLLRCRTAALGGHLLRCDRCGREVPLYNSCQDRHCPSCGTAAKERWLDARAAELLPVRYFHCVFTLPHALNGLVDANRARLIGELFSVVDWVLQHFAADPQWRLKGMLGFVAVLHTWTQRLLGHFHVHGLIPGGVWREASGEWIPCRGKWLFGKDSLAAAFRNRFLKRLRALRRRGKLSFAGPAVALGEEAAWEALLEALRRADWIVYPKCTARADRALDYLGRYTHKTAIGDHRIRSLENGQVTYTWRDRTHGNVEKLDTLPVTEFIERFLYHILPPGVRRIRYYGWLAPARKRRILPAIRAALHIEAPVPAEGEPAKESLVERILRRTGVDLRRCPFCGEGRLVNTRILIVPYDAQAPPQPLCA